MESHDLRGAHLRPLKKHRLFDKDDKDWLECENLWDRYVRDPQIADLREDSKLDEILPAREVDLVLFWFY